MVGRIVEETADRKTIGLIVECPECDHLHRVDIKGQNVASSSLED